jgi:four helix bundle protein
METPTTKRVFDLEERTFRFAKRTRIFLKTIPRGLIEADDREQLIRSSGSVAANYIEANEAISSKDFSVRIKICRKESRESQLWLRLFQDEIPPEKQTELALLIQEALELAKIFGAILKKLKES